MISLETRNIKESQFMGKASSQKFIARNRCPRVQIEYDVELYGAEKKVELPFVMGVMADLSGKPAEALPPDTDESVGLRVQDVLAAPYGRSSGGPASAPKMLRSN